MAAASTSSLKERNGKLLYGLLAINILAFFMFVHWDAIAAQNWAKLTSGVMAAVPAGVGVALTGFLNALVSADTKARLVFWRWDNPLPGSQAFSRYGPKSHRVDMVALAAKFGPLPTDAEAQNLLWYRLFKGVSGEPSVEHAHRQFLLARDFAFMALVMIVVLGGLALHFITPISHAGFISCCWWRSGLLRRAPRMSAGAALSPTSLRNMQRYSGSSDMEIEVFDVGHGHCSVVTTPAGHKIMVDCGTRSGDRLWWPSTHHYGREIAMLALMNLDEDHIRDFGDVLKECQVRSVLSNPSIGPAQLRDLKPEPMGPGAKAVLQWMNTPKGMVGDLSLDVDLHWFWNPYGGPCKSTNDLSLALFVRSGDFLILFAGDLEANGWDGMLKNDLFRQMAARVNVLVASHHGRRNGCHDPLFKSTPFFQGMTPHIVIISDDDKQHDTQETHAYYHWRCHGIPVLGTDRRRHVYTTRSDGSMHIGVKADGSWLITRSVNVQTYAASQPVPPPLNHPLRNGLGGFGGFGLINQPATNALTENLFGLGGGSLINGR